MDNFLYHGDNLIVLREHIPDDSIALVYLDPPFASQRDYLLLGTTPPGSGKPETPAFADVWAWDEEAYEAFRKEDACSPLTAALTALVEARKRDSLAAYLVMMAPRLIELRRVLSPTGSLYLHCAPAASHYLKILLDVLFRPENFRREIVWRSGWVSGFKTRAQNWVRNHDILLYYVRDQRHFTFHTEARFRPHPSGYTRRGGGASPFGIAIDDVWDEPALYSPWIKSFSREKCGYATQKPLALLDRIVRVSSSPGDCVLDPFCGGGTTLLAAQALGRHWIGIDYSAQAISLSRQRLAGIDYKFQEIGERGKTE
ncbi:MAG TPA: site-specific DNA-methyltransferase [Chthonomonadaceae bacterium]|nr:site-specific DNA-methyltransferase [Chthonomonadaceae bacterium]